MDVLSLEYNRISSSITLRRRLYEMIELILCQKTQPYSNPTLESILYEMLLDTELDIIDI